MSVYYTEVEILEMQKANREVHFRSRFGFQNAHNGFRRGSMHLVLGTTGGGKSTLVRTILKEIIFRRENINNTLCLWLSEESLAAYKQQLSYSMQSSELLHNIVARSEEDEVDVAEKDFFNWLKTMKPDIFIFDNITTSNFYETKKPQEQAAFARKLKNTLKDLNCACIIIAHTRADVSDTSPRMINIEDIMGSKSITRLVEFAYILQRFQVKDAFYPTLRIVKHRSQDLIHNLYLLNYEPKSKSFKDDTPMPFDKMKQIFDTRNKL
jgi:KaiC/GvpD/RAD55 family RecA-like ATPase